MLKAGPTTAFSVVFCWRACVTGTSASAATTASAATNLMRLISLLCPLSSKGGMWILARVTSLTDVVPREAVLEPKGRFLADLMGRGLQGTADAVVLPSTVDEVAAVMRWCYEHEVPLTARGGGTGLAGGAIPVEGGVVIGFERLNKVRAYDPLLWRMHVEAGVTTGDVQRLARESGLRFPPDPGAAEISQIGGNIACNAGGPHAFKYGVTGHWVTGIEAVIPPGEIVQIGGAIPEGGFRFDVESLLVGAGGKPRVVPPPRPRRPAGAPAPAP